MKAGAEQINTQTHEVTALTEVRGIERSPS